MDLEQDIRNKAAHEMISIDEKQLFIDLKIPKEERCKVPILHDDNGILCVGNFRDSEQYKVDETTKEVLKISFKKF